MSTAATGTFTPADFVTLSHAISSICIAVFGSTAESRQFFTQSVITDVTLALGLMSIGIDFNYQESRRTFTWLKML
ncbi:TPA: hypothetical protein ACKP7A_001510 [Serratia liquefaciens]